MNRPIKFRGKRVDNGEWVYGDLITKEYPIFTRLKQPLILDISGAWEVDINTIGQFTGLLDKNGTEIYEGDILSTKMRDVNFEMIWVQETASFMFKSTESSSVWEIDKSINKLEVIGNIHDID